MTQPALLSRGMGMACRFDAPRANCAIWRHARWATHGRPTEENAHPHRDCSGRVVVVHNGIIENYLALKKRLIEEGHKFTTETDTEVIAHQVEKYFLNPGTGQRPSLEEAVRKAVRDITGVFALAVIAV